MSYIFGSIKFVKAFVCRLTTVPDLPFMPSLQALRLADNRVHSLGCLQVQLLLLAVMLTLLSLSWLDISLQRVLMNRPACRAAALADSNMPGVSHMAPAPQGAPNLALADLAFNALDAVPALHPLVCLSGLRELRLNGNAVQEDPGWGPCVCCCCSLDLPWCMPQTGPEFVCLSQLWL